MTVIYRISSKTAPDYSKRADFPAPMVMRDIHEYHSPVTGQLITSRTERDADCKKHDAIPWEPGIGHKAGAKERTPGLYKNPKFAKKRGLPMSEAGHQKAKELAQT